MIIAVTPAEFLKFSGSSTQHPGSARPAGETAGPPAGRPRDRSAEPFVAEPPTLDPVLVRRNPRKTVGPAPRPAHSRPA